MKTSAEWATMNIDGAKYGNVTRGTFQLSKLLTSLIDVTCRLCFVLIRCPNKKSPAQSAEVKHRVTKFEFYTPSLISIYYLFKFSDKKRVLKAPGAA